MGIGPLEMAQKREYSRLIVHESSLFMRRMLLPLPPAPLSGNGRLAAMNLHPQQHDYNSRADGYIAQHSLMTDPL